MINNLENPDHPLEAQEKTLEKQEMLRRAMSLPPITQDDVLEIARNILESEAKAHQQ